MPDASYRHALLNPALDADAQRERLGADTLGIEVTVPALAAACGLGNLDPQHRPQGGEAAIAAALDHPLPPAGARLVTIRPDADAFGAMAVLGMRQRGVMFSPKMMSRIRAIAAADSFAHGAWPGPRELPRTAEAMGRLFNDGGISRLHAALATVKRDADRAVALVGQWIRTGRCPTDTARPAFTDALLAGLTDGTIRVSAEQGIALVRGCAPGALRLGYCLAPVVLAMDAPEGTRPRKMTLAQFAPDYIDLARARAKLAAIEDGWGGSDTLIGSPQGVACRTTPEQALAIAAECLIAHAGRRQGRRSIGSGSCSRSRVSRRRASPRPSMRWRCGRSRPSCRRGWWC